MIFEDYSSHFGRCVVVSHWDFNVHIPDDQWGRVSFPILTDHLDNFFREVEFFAFGTSELPSVGVSSSRL